MDVEVKQVIITRLTRRGRGVESDPIRIITEIWDMDGNKITEIDPEAEPYGVLKEANNVEQRD